MARTRRKVKKLKTIWEVPDRLWDEFIEPVLMKRDAPKATGRPRIDARRALNGIIYQMRSGCQWNYLPARFGSDRSIHRTFQRWIKLGVFDEIWALLIDRCDELGGVDWEWQSADAAMGKARMGGIKSAQTLRIAANRAPSAA